MKQCREWIFAAITAIMIGALVWLDPDPGAPSTLVFLHKLGMCAVAVWIVHLLLKLTQPYVTRKDLYLVALGSDVGAGLALIAQAIMWLAFSLLLASFARADVRTTIPANAHTHLPTLVAEQQAHWPAHPAPHLLASLIEHESCISLTHSRCWQPTSRLKSAREHGAGFGQLTQAYRADGSVRFDALAEARARHPSLSDLSWQNIYTRPDLQARAVVHMMRELHNSMPAVPGRMAFADAAYNGGAGGLQADRRACKLKAGCDPAQWFGHVEHTCTKSRAALYGQRSACHINRHHVQDVLLVRAAKYAKIWPGNVHTKPPKSIHVSGHLYRKRGNLYT
jgi:hypothetical protein